MRNHFVTFHALIIACFLLIFASGCGYKAPPFWSGEAPEDATVKTKKVDEDDQNASSNLTTGAEMKEYLSTHDKEKGREK